MSLQSFGRLPILSAFLLQLILSPTTSTFGLSTRRFWTPLRATASSYNDEENLENAEGQGNAFERVVQRVTGDADYKFGDITRSVVDSTTHGVEDAVRAVTHDENYHFGDITKKALGSTAGGIEGLVHSVTGSEDYKFGDLTRKTLNTAGSVMTYSEKSLMLMKDHNIHELIELLGAFWNKSMNEEERSEAFTTIVYLGAIAVLAYNFVANFVSGFVFAAAWARISVVTGTSPLSAGMWEKFLHAKYSLDMFFGGPCIPAKAILTIPIFFGYRRFVVNSTSKSPLKERFPIINRYLSLMLAWLVANVGVVGGATYLMVKITSFWTGVPMFPVAP